MSKSCILLLNDGKLFHSSGLPSFLKHHKKCKQNFRAIIYNKGDYMIRNPYVIKCIYGLDEVRRDSTQAQDDVVKFLKGINDGYNTKHWNFPKNMYDDYFKLATYADHADFFKSHITFLPYAKLESVQNIIENHPRWKLAQKYGLRVRVEPTRKEIFEEELSCKYIIIISCTDWTTLRNNIRKDLYTQWEESWTLD